MNDMTIKQTIINGYLNRNLKGWRTLLAFLLSFLAITHFSSYDLYSELPRPALIGYWHNWDNPQAPFLAPDKLHPAYNVITVSFAVPRTGTDYDMYFHPLVIKKDDFKSRIKKLQSSGKKVLISLGGGNTSVTLDSTYEKEVFVQSVLKLLYDYEFDGFDVDFEGNSIRLSGGTIKKPQDSSIILLIEAVREIMSEYRFYFKRKAILTIAPETAYAQGGQSGWGGIWGAYLPILDALRDSIDGVAVQLYNSGDMYGLDKRIYKQGTADFIVSQTEALALGFKTSKGELFEGFPEEKIFVGLPACPLAAGSGWTEIDTIESAMKYLIGKTDLQPAGYKLRKIGGYPRLGGMMTWSVNWDASDSCTSEPHSFASNFSKVFGIQSSIREIEKTIITRNTIKDIYFDLRPNPASETVRIQFPDFATRFFPLKYEINDLYGTIVSSGRIDRNGYTIDIKDLESGVYFISCAEFTEKFIKK